MLLNKKKKLLPKEAPSSLPSTVHHRCIMIDFMGYARKVPIKEMKLKTYRDFARNLWNSFQSYSSTSNHTDIVFDLYKDLSIKGNEHNRRKKTGVVTYIQYLIWISLYLLTWKNFGLSQITRLHFNVFSFNGPRKTLLTNVFS